MEKVIEAGSWKGPGMDNPVQMVKMSQRGLIGSDRADFLKMASHEFVDFLDNLKLARDEIPIHLVAIGSDEGYGANRNGDAFKESTCRDVHPTFIKHSRYYRNHQNKDPKKSYGLVKLSTYNDPMRRIELLVIGNGSKAAAERNGGLPMKQATIDKLYNGELVPFSMACQVPHDVCANCMNKAANRREYCTEDTCISPDTGRRGFGCKTGLTKVAADGHMQKVFNPNAKMIDISEVGRPADRTAYGGLADYMQKAASLGYVPGGAELAEMWAKQGADFTLIDPETELFRQDVVRQMKLARELAEIERSLESGPNEIDKAHAWALSRQPDMDLSPLREPGVKVASVVSALAAHKIAMPVQDFLRMVVRNDDEKLASLNESVPRHLPGVFGRLVADEDFGDVLYASPYLADQRTPSRHLRDWAEKMAAAFSLEPEAVRTRVFRSAARTYERPGFRDETTSIKTASANSLPEKYARHYALYKLATLAEMLREPDLRAGELKRLAVCQHYVTAD